MSKPRLRDTSGRRFAKYATAAITNHLQAVAEETGVNVRKVVADKLYETYTDNVKKSYRPRSPEGGSYEHTDTFLNSIYVDIESNAVKVKIDNTTYPQISARTTEQVYKYLTEGTNGGGTYNYWDENENIINPVKSGYNYPTPKHDFEEHTIMQMKGFMQSLEGDIRNGKYSVYRYTGKKKKRKYYKGQRVY